MFNKVDKELRKELAEAGIIYGYEHVEVTGPVKRLLACKIDYV